MSLPLLTRKSVLLAKVESAYGSDSGPTAGSNAILVENLKFGPKIDIIDRDNISSPDLSPIAHLVGSRSAEISFDCELKGSLVSNITPPDFGCLFRASSMSETIGASSVIYAPESTTQESVTIYAYKDGQLHKFTGCVGDWKMSGEVGKPVKISFTFKGQYVTPVDSALVTPTFVNLTPPLLLGATFTYGGWSPPMSKLSLNMNNNVAERADLHEGTGILGFFVASRKPDGSCDPEADLLSTRDVWANLMSANSAVLSAVIGSVTGNIITIAAPKCVKKSVDWGDRSGIMTYDINFNMFRNTGNDELTLTFT